MISSVKKQLNSFTRRGSREQLRESQEATQSAGATCPARARTSAGELRKTTASMTTADESSYTAKPIAPKKMVNSKIDCSKPVPASAVSYEMVTIVIDSWESKVRTIPNWLAVTGELFLRKMFELDPETITMFGFPEDTKYDDPELKNNEKFMAKGMRLVEAIDIAVGFLGPDLEPLEETLFELGGRHVERQCRPHHWPIVGEALFYVMEQGLGDAFTFEVREAWTILYNFLGYHMIRGLLAKCPALAE